MKSRRAFFKTLLGCLAAAPAVPAIVEAATPAPSVQRVFIHVKARQRGCTESARVLGEWLGRKKAAECIAAYRAGLPVTLKTQH